MAPLSAPGTERARAAFALQLLFGLLPLPFVALRLWSRKISRVGLCFNDWTIIAALIVFWGITANDLFAINSAGIGQHVSQLTPSELDIDSVETLPPTVLWLVTTGLIRVSILHFYLTVFSAHPPTRLISYILLIASACFCIASTLAAVFFCHRIAAAWSSVLQNGHCGNWQAFFLATAIISTVLDVAIVLTPQPCIWELHLPRDRKIPMAVIFGIGGIISLFSILRCWSVATIDSSDITYSILFDQFMTQLEPALGIVNACIPILVPAIAHASRYRYLTWLRHLIPKSSSEQLEKLKRGDGSNNSRWKLGQWWRSFRSEGSNTAINVVREVEQSSEHGASPYNSMTQQTGSVFSKEENNSALTTKISTSDSAARPSLERV